MISPILKTKLIACCASLFPDCTGKCLGLETTVGIIKASRSGALIYHVPDQRSRRDLQAYEFLFEELLEKLGDTSRYAILANTSRAESVEGAIAYVERNLEAFDSFKNLIRHQEKPVIKLEILRKHNKILRSDDAAVVEATRKILANYQVEVIPLLSPDPTPIAACTNAGVSMVRLLAGVIGAGSGPCDQPQLRRAIAVATVPVVLEGGIATPEHVKSAFGMGAAAVLINSAFQKSPDPIALARELRATVDNWSRVSAQAPP
jgi:thiazole synthase ThiGH ThiG subunit